MATLEFTVITDENGYYQRTQTFDAPGPFPLTVDLKAKLLSPNETQVIATLDIDAADGDPQNQVREFRASTGEQISLGTWHIDGAANIIVASGHTVPNRANTEVKIELEVTL